MTFSAASSLKVLVAIVCLMPVAVLAQHARPQAPQPNPAPSRVDTSLMPRYCQGEASAKFGVRPQELTTNIAFKSGNNYVVQGNFDRDGSTTFFNCWFGLDGSFGYIN